jgi:hypothetical protein
MNVIFYIAVHFLKKFLGFGGLVNQDEHFKAYIRMSKRDIATWLSYSQ